MSFENIEVYVRYREIPYEGQDICFVTIDPEQAATKDIDDSHFAAECLDIYINGEQVDHFVYTNGKWLNNRYSREQSKEFKTETIVIHKEIGQ